MKDDTHERILEGTAELVAHHGYRPGRIEDIADHVGVSVKTIYNHFGSKQALVLAVIRRNQSILFRRLTEVLDRDDLSFPAKVHAMVEHGIERVRQQVPRLVEMLGLDAPGIAQRVLPGFRRRFIEVLSRLYEQGLAAGAIDPSIDAETMGYSILCLIQGHIMVSRNGPQPQSPEQFLRRAINIQLLGVLSPEARSEARALMCGFGDGHGG